MARFLIQLPPHSTRELEQTRIEYSLEAMIRDVKYAEGKGIYGACLAENSDLREPIVPLTLFAVHTRNIRLALSISSVYIRSPLLMAKTMANLNELSKGRVILGIGRGAAMYQKREGTVFDRPIKTLKEYIEVLRLALDGHKFSFSGEIFKYSNAQLGFNPTMARLPIYIGASGPKTLAIAGAVADGVYPKAFLSTDLFNDAVRSVFLGAKVAGREPSEIEVVRSFILSICRDSALAKRIAKGKIIFHLLNDPDLIPETTVHSDIRSAIELGNVDRALSLVPDTAVESLTVSGTPEECKSKLRDYIARFSDLGVETFRVQPLGPTPNEAFMSAVDILSAAG